MSTPSSSASAIVVPSNDPAPIYGSTPENVPKGPVAAPAPAPPASGGIYGATPNRVGVSSSPAMPVSAASAIYGATPSTTPEAAPVSVLTPAPGPAPTASAVSASAVYGTVDTAAFQNAEPAGAEAGGNYGQIIHVDPKSAGDVDAPPKNIHAPPPLPAGYIDAPPKNNVSTSRGCSSEASSTDIARK